MRIAQVAPLYESVPPQGYGGTERIVSYITEELVRVGHQVTLFASGDSHTAAELVWCSERALRLDRHCFDPLAHHVLLLERVRSRAAEFDLIHYHIDALHFPLSRMMKQPHVTTMHGRQDVPDLVPLYEEFLDTPLISISDAQREPVPWAKWIGTVYHGLPEELYTPVPNPTRDYLAYVGRIAPEKGLERAIETAQHAGIRFAIAAKVDKADREYFEARIKPLLSLPGIEFIGEITQAEKNAFLGNALALLFQIDWPEPFGLAMIEALACGTPVLTRPRGSVPEIIMEGVTGYISDDLQAAVRAVEAVRSIDPATCRREFERRFTVKRMVQDYLRLYTSLIDQWPNIDVNVGLPRGAGSRLHETHPPA